jgi:ABC-type multidrug transport system fused ATPase/permease subunit
VPLFWLAARYFSRLIKRAAREERRRSGSTNAVAEESLSNAALVQAYNRQDFEVARFHRENLGSFAAQMASTRLSATFSPLVNLIELAGVLVVIAVGTWELSQGRLSIGGLLVFMVYLSQLYTPIRGLSSLLNKIYAASAGEICSEVVDQRFREGRGVPSLRAIEWDAGEATPAGRTHRCEAYTKTRPPVSKKSARCSISTRSLARERRRCSPRHSKPRSRLTSEPPKANETSKARHWWSGTATPGAARSSAEPGPSRLGLRG